MLTVRAVALLVALVLLLGGCGGTADPIDTPSSSAAAGNGFTPEERAVADVVERYLHAFAARDFAAACATRAARERREFARLAGDCVAGMRMVYARAASQSSAEQLGETMAAAKITQVTIKGRWAAALPWYPDLGDDPVPMAAVREGGEWKLVDVSDARARSILNSGD